MKPTFDELNVVTIFSDVLLDAFSLNDVADAVAVDIALTLVCRHCTAEWLPSDKKNPVLGLFFKNTSELSVTNEVVYRENLTVIFEQLRPQVQRFAHEWLSGIVKMRQRLRDCAWLPGIDSDVDAHVKHCKPCLLSDKSARPSTLPLQPI